MDLGRQWILWCHFRSSVRAIKYVQHKRLKELEKEFPPWYAQKTDEQIGRVLIIAMIRSCTCSFVESVFNGADWFFPTFWASFTILFLIETLLIHGLTKRWHRKHSGHPYATSQARKEARARAKMVDIDLYRATLDELIALYDAGPVFEKVSAYRDQDPTRVRIEIMVKEACRSTGEMVCDRYPPCKLCYTGYEELLAVLESREQEQKQRVAASR